MIPPKTDPRWKKLVQAPDDFKTKVTSLHTRVMLSGLKIRATTNSLEQMIDNCHEFFVKNEKMVAADIDALFA